MVRGGLYVERGKGEEGHDGCNQFIVIKCDTRTVSWKRGCEGFDFGDELLIFDKVLDLWGGLSQYCSSGCLLWD